MAAAQEKTSPNRPRVENDTTDVHDVVVVRKEKECHTSKEGATSSESTATSSSSSSPSSSSLSSSSSSPSSAQSVTYKARNQLFQIGIEMGNLSSAMLQYAPSHDPVLKPSSSPSSLLETEPFWTSNCASIRTAAKDKGQDQDQTAATGSDSNSSTSSTTASARSYELSQIHNTIEKFFKSLIVFCEICDINLTDAILKKIVLNKRKYRPQDCKGKCEKYTAYSSQTGIGKNNQSTMDIEIDKSCTKHYTTMDVILQIRQCAIDRDWHQFHTPRNLTLAIMGEVGELADLFQFKGDYVNGVQHDDESKLLVDDENEIENDNHDDHVHTGLRSEGWNPEKIDKVHQEIADVAIYCLELVDVLGIQERVNLVV